MNFHELLQRANLNSLETFLLYGGESCETPANKTYSERLEEAMKNATDFFKERYKTIPEYDEITTYFDKQVAVFEEVYFEIGVIVGAKIGLQLSEKINELM